MSERPSRRQSTRPACLMWLRWNESVAGARPRLSPSAPAGSPAGPASTSRRKMSSRVSWARPARAASAAIFSIFPILSKNVAKSSPPAAPSCHPQPPAAAQPEGRDRDHAEARQDGEIDDIPAGDVLEGARAPGREPHRREDAGVVDRLHLCALRRLIGIGEQIGGADEEAAPAEPEQAEAEPEMADRDPRQVDAHAGEHEDDAEEHDVERAEALDEMADEESGAIHAEDVPLKHPGGVAEGMAAGGHGQGGSPSSPWSWRCSRASPRARRRERSAGARSRRGGGRCRGA